MREYALNAVIAAPEQLRLLELQAVDLRLDQLAHQRRTLPEEVTLAGLVSTLAQLRDRIIAGETEFSDLESAVGKAEADVEQVRARSRRDQELLDSGHVNSAKELQSLQHEVASLQRRQTDLEDLELEVLERAENARNSVASLVAQRSENESARESAAAARDAALADIEGESVQAAAERALLAETIPAELLSLYAKLREVNTGVGAAALHQGRCEGCRMELTPVDLGRIRAAAPEAVVRCEECRRILIRTAVSGL